MTRATRSPVLAGMVLLALGLACRPDLPVQAGAISDAGLTGDALVTACPAGSPALPGPGVFPVTEILPGESTACAALAPLACEVLWYEGDAVYGCYDTEGNGVDESPCSNDQLSAWTENFHACWKLVPASAIAASPVAPLLQTSLIPSQVCASMHDTSHWFVAGCALHHLRYQKLLSTGGNWRFGAYWSLTIAPATTALLATTSHPFLACSQFLADLNCEELTVETLGGQLEVKLADVSAPWCSGTDWPSNLAAIVKGFTNCAAGFTLFP